MAIFSKNNKDFIAPLYVGTNEQSEDIFIDFSRIRNLLLFGDMGAGKTNLMNNMVISLIENFSPEQCKIALFDTKSVEFYQFENVKHLYCKVNDHDEIIDSLKSIHMLIQERYRLLSNVKCMNITKYNSQADNKLPYIVCFIDEIAELILNYPQEILELMENISHGFPVGVFLIAGTKEFMPEVFNAKLRFLFENFITFKTNKEKCSVDYMKIYLNDIKPYTIKKTGQHIIRLQLGDSKVLEGKFISDEIIEQKINLINQLLNNISDYKVV